MDRKDLLFAESDERELEREYLKGRVMKGEVKRSIVLVL